MRGWISALLMLSVLSGMAHAEPPALQPGLYEVLLKTDFGAAQSAVPVNTVRRCISATEVATPQRLAPQFSGGAACTTSDLKVGVNDASWMLTCAGEPAMRGDAKLSWNTSTYAGQTSMTLTRGGEKMQMTQSYTARRIGGC